MKGAVLSYTISGKQGDGETEGKIRGRAEGIIYILDCIQLNEKVRLGGMTDSKGELAYPVVQEIQAASPKRTCVIFVLKVGRQMT